MTKNRLVAGAIMAAAGLLHLSPASAATDTFMIVPGIPGDSRADRYRDAIELQGVQQSFTGDRRISNPCSVSVVKTLDRAGPRLWAAAMTEQVFAEIRIDVVEIGLRTDVIYRIVLANAQVDAISTALSEVGTENVTISGASATLTFFPQRADGSIGPGISETISCANGR